MVHGGQELCAADAAGVLSIRAGRDPRWEGEGQEGRERRREGKNYKKIGQMKSHSGRPRRR